MTFNQCQYINRNGITCGKNCLAEHKQSTRCALHRGKISSVKCLGCDTWTRSMSQLCTGCNKATCSIDMTPFLLTKEEIDHIISKREKEKNDQAAAEDSD